MNDAERKTPRRRPAAWKAACVALCAQAVLSAAPPVAAQDPDFGPPGSVFVLRALGRCLEVNEPQLPVDGARVQLQRCDGQPNQAWRHERGRLVNVASGRCLDVHGPDAGLNGARVQVVGCSAAPNQQWRLERGGQLVVRVDERCLEAEVPAEPSAGEAAPGSGPGAAAPTPAPWQAFERRRPLLRAQTWDCRGAPWQRWRVSPLPVAAGPAVPPAPPSMPAPPRTRDVEAGPLFSNAEAAQKCPRACAPGRWTGQWVTTVPGRMSVCGCAFDGGTAPPSPVPPAPPSPSGPAQPQAMPAERFDELVRVLDEEAFPSNALRTLEMVARDQRFMVDQVSQLFEVFPFPRDRLRVVEITLPRVIDRANTFRWLSAFDFERDKAEVRRLIEAQGRGR